MTEEWREIPGYEGWYEVSSLGQVRRDARAGGKGTPLRAAKNKSGYISVTLSVRYVMRSVTVHRLVAWAFLGPQATGIDVRHKDGTRDNNVVSNLEYGTRSENIQDSVRHGTQASIRKTECKNGHPFTPENTYRRPANAGRHCRECGRIATRALYRRTKGEAA